jgi:SWI/SNF-related matrix-associated actin-dependent regulator of chromatin subfamily A member 5
MFVPIIKDRAHRIGQKKEVQVFRLVTEHTIEEKVVERAQQKLKLDAMVVQQGRLKDKDSLSSEQMLEAVRFGADKVFKSKDSSITDDDIDMILDQGKKKTQEMNEKLQNAEKGDMLDFKLDGGISTQTFEGIDYSQRGKDMDAVKAAQVQAELLGIMDMGKRERRTVANYNEDQLYKQQIALQQGGRVKVRKKKETRLPKYLRLPRMEEWQMFDRDALHALQEMEENAFRALPEEQQKLATTGVSTIDNKADEQNIHCNGDDKAGEDIVQSGPVIKSEGSNPSTLSINVNAMPPLLSEEQQAEKKKLLAEGFADWGRHHYSAFIKVSAKMGRDSYAKIAEAVGKPQSSLEDFAAAFWNENIGKKRFSEHEYERVVKLIERGEKKLHDIKSIERCTGVLLSLFENPWVELEFNHANYKDKMFTMHEDRHLLCWAHKVRYILFYILLSVVLIFSFFIVLNSRGLFSL